MTDKKLTGAALGKFGTPGLLDELIKLVEKGNNRTEAAKRCKIAPRTFVYWMQRGQANLDEVAKADQVKPGSGVLDEFGLFRLEIEKAEATIEAGLKDAVMKKALKGDPDSWKAAGWLLERRFRKRWGRDVELEEGEEVNLTDAAVDADVLRNELRDRLDRQQRKQA